MIKKFLIKRRQISEDLIEVLKIPIGEPPEKPATGAQPDLEGLKKLAELKAPLVEKFKMPSEKL